MSTDPADLPTDDAATPLPLEVRIRKRPARPIQIEPLKPMGQPRTAPAADAADFRLEAAQPSAPVETDVGVRARRLYVGEAQKDFVLKEVDKLHRAGKHPDEIAATFGVHIRTAYNWLAELKRNKGEEAKAIDPYPLIGEAMANFQAIKSAAWAIHADIKIKPADRVKALSEARAAETAMGGYLKEAGLFGRDFILRASKAATENPDENRAEAFTGMLRGLFEGARDFATSGLEPEEVSTEDGEGADE
jgi:hypothetical protein